MTISTLDRRVGALSLQRMREPLPGRLVQTSSGQLHVRVSGDGPDLVLVHGVTDNGRTWDRVMPALTPRARVHAIDLPGHGLSDVPARPLSVAEMAHAVADYLAAAGISRCVVAGNSLGGGVTLVLAALQPERVCGAVAFGSIGLPFTLPLGLRLLRVPGATHVMRWLSRAPRVARPFMRRMFFHRDYLPSQESLEAYWSGWRVRERARYIRRLMRVLDVAEPATLLATIRVPVHVVHGDSDRVIPPRIGRELAAAIANARVTMLERTGHAPQNERPEATAELILEMVAATTCRESVQ